MVHILDAGHRTYNVRCKMFALLLGHLKEITCEQINLFLTDQIVCLSAWCSWLRGIIGTVPVITDLQFYSLTDVKFSLKS